MPIWRLSTKSLQQGRESADFIMMLCAVLVVYCSFSLFTAVRSRCQYRELYKSEATLENTHKSCPQTSSSHHAGVAQHVKAECKQNVVLEQFFYNISWERPVFTGGFLCRIQLDEIFIFFKLNWFLNHFYIFVRRPSWIICYTLNFLLAMLFFGPGSNVA